MAMFKYYEPLVLNETVPHNYNYNFSDSGKRKAVNWISI